MKIKLEALGLPTLAGLIGKKTEVEFGGGTVVDLISLLTQKHGRKVREILLDSKGELDLTIQVMLNDEGFLSRDTLAHRALKEGDKVRFMLLAGGG